MSPEDRRHLDEPPVAPAHALAVDDFEDAQHAGKRRADIVADDGEEARFRLGRLLRHVPGLLRSALPGGGLVERGGERGRALDHLVLEHGTALLQARRHQVELVAELLELVAGVDRDALVELAAPDPQCSFAECPDRRDEPAAQHDAGENRPDQRHHENGERAQDRGVDRRKGFLLRQVDHDAPVEIGHFRHHRQHRPALGIDDRNTGGGRVAAVARPGLRMGRRAAAADRYCAARGRRSGWAISRPERATT